MAKKGLSLDDIVRSHHKGHIIPARIKKALAELGDTVEYEADFIRRAGVSTTDFARHREPFMAHCIELPRLRGSHQAKRAWVGTVKAANKLRDKLAE